MIPGPPRKNQAKNKACGADTGGGFGGGAGGYPRPGERGQGPGGGAALPQGYGLFVGRCEVDGQPKGATVRSFAWFASVCPPQSAGGKYRWEQPPVLSCRRMPLWPRTRTKNVGVRPLPHHKGWSEEGIYGDLGFFKDSVNSRRRRLLFSTIFSGVRPEENR